MNFFKDKELAQRFANNNVSSKERFKYFIAFMFITCILVSASYTNTMWQNPDGSHINLTDVDIFSDIFVLLSTLIGSYILYIINRSGDDKEFIERYVCLGFPVMCKGFVLIIVVSFLYPIILALTSGTKDFIKTFDSGMPYFMCITLMIFTLYFYYRLYICVKIASGVKNVQ
jgi:nitric oxide reductase large subunit